MPPPVTSITKGSRRKPRIVEIRADKIKVDPRVQRALIPARVKALAAKLDLDGLGVLTVSEREGGEFVVLDGQHRLEALRAHDMGEWEVTCHVYRGLTLAQEAAFFRRHNDQRAITPYDNFSKGLVEGDHECVAINAILEDHGLKLASAGRDGAISAVQKVRQIWALDEGETLDAVLGVVVEAWGRRSSAVEKPIIGGMAIVISTYGDELDRARLATKLSKSAGGASGLIGKARALKDIRSESVERLVAEVVVAIYNQSRRSGKLAAL